MADNDTSIAAMRESLAMANEEVGRAQASLAAAQDRADAARQIVLRVMKGSGKEEAAAAAAGLVDMKENLDQAIAASLVVKDQVDAFAATL